MPRPSTWSPAAAAALPTVYTTVDVAFAELAKLKKGEKVATKAVSLESSWTNALSCRCSSMLQPVELDWLLSSMRSVLVRRQPVNPE